VKKKILYIVGLSRSGSTIVDIVLGNNRDSLSCGELTNVFEDAFVLNQICSCGQRGNDCEYWQTIKKEWEAKSSIDLSEFVELIKKYEKNGFLQWTRLFINIFIHKTKKFKTYIYHTKLFLDILYNYNQINILIDSSKRILRFMILRKVTDYDVLPIYLIRNLKGVLASFAQHSKPGIHKQVMLSKTIFHYFLLNLQIRLILLFYKHKHLNYEEMLQNPQKELQEIKNLFDVDLQESINKVTQERVLAVSHIISGSHIRTHSNLILQNKPSNKWRKIVPPFYVKLSDIINKILI
jgi:hypothetical protein